VPFKLAVSRLQELVIQRHRVVVVDQVEGLARLQGVEGGKDQRMPVQGWYGAGIDQGGGHEQLCS
jgi:hypothetical protein